MKKSLLFTILTCCLVLTGCGGSKKSGEDIQKKIDEAGWEVTYDKGGTVSDSVDLELKEDETLLVIHDKEGDKISTVSYSGERSEGDYLVSRDLGEKDDIGSVRDNNDIMSCFLYNVTKDEVDTSNDTKEMDKFKACGANEASQLKELVKSRDEALKKVDLTIDDLFTWGEWYFKNK